jgi:hypothetical protein
MPNHTHPLPEQFRKFAGSTAPSTEPVPNQFRTGGENSPQMEDEGGRMEDGDIKSTSDDVDTAAANPSNGRAYAFEAKTIRLTEKHFGDWKRAFPHVALEAELWSLDDWAGQQGKRWFAAVSGALAKKEREAVERTAAAREKRDAATSPPRREGRI